MLSRRAFLAGLVTTAAGVLIPAPALALPDPEPARRLWALDTTMILPLPGGYWTLGIPTTPASFAAALDRCGEALAAGAAVFASLADFGGPSPEQIARCVAQIEALDRDALRRAGVPRRRRSPGQARPGRARLAV